MICPVYRIAEHNPTAIFLCTDDRNFSYVEFNERIRSKEFTLHQNGYQKGDRLAIVHSSVFEIACWLFACARQGVSLAILSDRDPSDHHDLITQQHNIALLHHDQMIASDHLISDPDHPINTRDHPIIECDHPCTILFTSGSSSVPKAVVHSFVNHWSSAQFSAENIAYVPGDRWLLSLSLWHIGGLAILFRTIQARATAITRDPTRSLSVQIEEDVITHVSVVATQLSDILSTIPRHQLKAILVGGGPIPPSLVDRALEHKLPIHTTYGMTELCSQLSTTPPQSSKEILRSAGYLLGDWCCKLSESGEICVKGSPLFLGYWNGISIDPRRDSDGFFHTNDTGYVQNELLYPVGRLDQMFISGGENIHPEEIEKILRTQVKQAIVVPIPHSRYGQRPVAFLFGEYQLDEIETLLSEALPKFKHPDYYFPWPANISRIKPSRSSLRSLASSYLNTLSLKNKQ